MSDVWPMIMPLLRRQLLGALALLLLLGGTWGGLWYWHGSLLPAHDQAQAELAAAREALERAHTDQAEINAHRQTFEGLRASGLIGEPQRAVWVDDLLVGARDLGLDNLLSYTLAAPEELQLAQAQEVGAKVTRHVLTWDLKEAHELDALRLVRRLVQARHGVARLAGCSLALSGDAALSSQCRVNFLHIEPAAPPAQNARP